MRTKLIAVLVLATLWIPTVVLAQDGVVDRTARQAAEPVEPAAVDSARDRIADSERERCREIDFESDRCCPDRPATDVADRCRDVEPPHDVNIRRLIWRLIKAHEWEKLFRLLHRLGIL